MNTGRLYKTVIGILSFFFITACASVGIPVKHESGVTIQDLERDWNEYAAYYSTSSYGRPTAIMFDPKNDQNKLTGDGWTRVENQGTLSALISNIQAFARHSSTTWSIMGPGNQLFGYIFTPSPQILMKAVDAHTIYVYRVLSRQETTSK